nr:hypothetical protein [Acetobacter pomorum]
MMSHLAFRMIWTVSTSSGYTGATADTGLIGEVGHQKKERNPALPRLRNSADLKLSSLDATFNMALQQLMPTSLTGQ